MTAPLILIAILSANLSACNVQTSLPPYQPPKSSTMQEIIDFAKRIEQIGTQVKQLDLPEELFAPEAFRAIYENPQPYLASAMALIARKDLSTHHKNIIGYSMQKLPPEQFVAFVSSMADSVEQGNTDISVLETTAFAPLNWGRQSLIMHYQQAPVPTLLERLLAMPQLSPANQEYIRDDISTGKAKQDYLDYMDMLGRPVRE